MFSSKSPSPSQLAFISAVIIAVPIALAVAILSKKWLVAAGFLLLVLAGCYGLLYFLLEKFISRKIKLIYKLIHQTKATKKEEMYFKYVLPEKSIDQVRDEVEAWARRTNSEIELLRKNEAFRKDFLQNLAHEFKTPVFAIQGYTDTLLNGAMEDPGVNRKFLENTAKNADRLVSLLNDLDEISRLENGEQLLLKQNFIIQDLIRDVFESLTIKTQEKRLRTSIKKGCEAPISVFADKERIRQVLINLTENAAKYGRLNGSIVASVYLTDDQRVLVEISDDGIGIEEEHLPRIFERFYRTDNARSRDRGGTGLGLAICKHIIEAHNQSMHVRSTPNVGTTIGFTLAARQG